MQDGHPIGLNVPQVSDTSKTYFRLNGLSDNILVERSSEVLEKYIQDDVPSDSIFFEEHIRADLEKRVPAFKNCTIESAASGFYEYCTFDESGIIGPHPAYHSIYMATGFNGHGKTIFCLTIKLTELFDFELFIQVCKWRPLSVEPYLN